MNPLLDEILAPGPAPFAVLHRPHVTGPDAAELLTGDVVTVERLADLPVGEGDVLAAVPFRQVAERGFEHVDDGAPLLALRVRRRATVPLADLLAALPAGGAEFTETGYDVPDAEYEATVRTVLADEIGAGAGSNFVVHRALTGRSAASPARTALVALRRLLAGERHAYWTFALHTPSLTFVGASPERHVSLDGGVVRMNPISGTLRHPAGGFASAAERREAVLAFLDDAKERDELAMVVDEELKMMAVVAERGGTVRGPFLKEMTHLTHTEYVLEGRTALDVRDVLRATMFAPTVTGSPIRNACRVIARHERRGRGHYGGVLALTDTDDGGRQRLDAPILIRTAELRPDPAGGSLVRVPAGATLVRGSRPEAELAETRAKAAAVLAALRGDLAPPSAAAAARVADDPDVALALVSRNATLAPFWLTPQPVVRDVRAGRVTILEAEDDFTAMLAHQLRALGRPVDLVPWQGFAAVAAAPGIVVLGPGPGDPRDLADPRIAALRSVARSRLDGGLPTFAVCLGHQVLAAELGLALERLPVPNQGVQETVDVFGERHAVGFYNSFAAIAPDVPAAGVELAADPVTRRVHAVRGAGFEGVQFHAESVLSTRGAAIVHSALNRLEAAS